MYDEFPFTKERNPVTQLSHRKQVLWQITIPLVIGVVIILIVAILVTTGSPQTASLWADISLIWLIIPVMIASLILLVLLAGLAYAVIWLVRTIPGYALQAQNFMIMIAGQVERLGDMIVEPILRVNAFLASLQALSRSLRRK
jgi:uncharacterized membrane protein YobD (UPF0266 family)